MNGQQLNETLNNYLELEKILNEFLNVFNFCLPCCIEIEKTKHNALEVAACCKDKYYKRFDVDHPAFDLLKKERESIYGRPEDIQNSSKISPCEYHTQNGCILKTHKSPVCIGFMCRPSIDVLRTKYDIIEYDYLGMYYALEWQLTGDLSEKQYQDFKQTCIDITEKLKTKHFEVLKWTKVPKMPKVMEFCHLYVY